MQNAASRKTTLTEKLQSPRLREVNEHYGDVRRPNAVVAASAVFRASKIVNGRMEAALTSLDLTPARYELLGLLHNTEGGRMSLRDLSKATLHHPATMTYTIDTLEKRKLLRRKPDPTDRRAVLAEVTASGRRLVDQASQLLEDVEWGLADLTEGEAETVAVILSRIHPT